MSHIKILSPHVSTLIAAGEVVERPVSAVKELVENSIDAGALAITVEIEKGGVKYIRVSDDGRGIPPGEAKTAFLRHATSKLETADDLAAIKTLGFRGEALASIAAVSRVDIFSKQENEIEGIHAAAEGGKILESRPAGCPVGTTITVKNLFYNTPARMKFLKRDATEAGYIEECLKRFALARPDISIKYINTGREVFFTPGDGRLENAVHAVYGGDWAKHMIFASYDNGRVAASGLIGKSELSRPNRSFQSFFVNGRCVSNSMLHVALGEGYKNKMTVGRFPVAVLNLAVDERAVDVNVHPAKTLVKFEDEKSVFDAVYWAVKNALNAGAAQPRSGAGNVPAPPDKAQTSMGAGNAPAPPDKAQPGMGAEYAPAPPDKAQTGMGAQLKQMGLSSISLSADAPYGSAGDLRAGEGDVSTAPAERQPAAEQSADIYDEAPARLIGQVFGTYIIAQKGDEMLLIDQHAAHERIKYEEILENARGEGIKSQVLLVPEVVELSPVESAVFKENAELFTELGFEIESFGNNSLIVRMQPFDIEGATGPTVIEILDIIANLKTDVITKGKELALYTLACKAAVKGNTALKPDEQKALVDEVLRLSGKETCPHGRPIIVRITKREFEKKFKRVL